LLARTQLEEDQHRYSRTKLGSPRRCHAHESLAPSAEFDEKP
jgi:hypothetical protein